MNPRRTLKTLNSKYSVLQRYESAAIWICHVKKADTTTQCRLQNTSKSPHTSTQSGVRIASIEVTPNWLMLDWR
jgi:hypothetical protein